MTGLLIVLASIALLDSLSVIPLAVVPLAAILAGPRPLNGSASLLAGIFAVYALCGAVILLGLDTLFDAVGPSLKRWWNDPDTLDLILQLAIGAAMIGFGWKLAAAREEHGERGAGQAVGPVRAFAIGAGITAVGLPGALPYFGAIDQILRADPTFAQMTLALLFYNLVFVSPLIALVALRWLFPERSERLLRGVASITGRWGRRLIVAVLLVLGGILIADAVAWFFGYPLLPIE